jgi:hypothetical protein
LHQLLVTAADIFWLNVFTDREKAVKVRYYALPYFMSATVSGELVYVYIYIRILYLGEDGFQILTFPIKYAHIL